MIAKIKFTKPEGTDEAMLAEFINDALSSWGGQFHPEDPLFHSLRDRMEWIIINGKKFTCKEEANA